MIAPLRRAALAVLLLVVPASAAVDPVRGALRLANHRVAAEITIAAGFHINAHEPRDEFLVPTVLEVTAPPGVAVGAVEYPAPVERTLSFSPTPLLLYQDKVTFSAPVTGDGHGTFVARLRYQACDDSTCLPPRTLTMQLADDATAPASAPTAGVPADNQVASLVARWGTPITLLWIFLGGIALNLTPCVYPLISVTVSFFGGRTASAGYALGNALCYALGICLTFTALGVTAALTGSLFGAALQQPAVLGGIALVLVALALSNFGLWQIRPPSALMQVVGRAGDGALGALFMGLTMGIVAAPCIGPFALGLLVYVGARQDVWLGFVMFLALGLGLGAPYVLLATAAHRLRRLPRGGAWLGWMEHLFGFLLLGIALHFATPLLASAAVQFAWTALMVAAGIWLGFGGTTGARVVRGGLGIATILAALAGYVRTEAPAPIRWLPYSDAALTGAASIGHAALIDFQADWCIPCREMDHTTFRDPAVAAAAQNFVMLRADVTAQDEAATALMSRYQVLGVPTYVLLDATGKERRRFVGLVPADQMRAAMEEITRG